MHWVHAEDAPCCLEGTSDRAPALPEFVGVRSVKNPKTKKRASRNSKPVLADGKSLKHTCMQLNSESQAPAALSNSVVLSSSRGLGPPGTQVGLELSRTEGLRAWPMRPTLQSRPRRRTLGRGFRRVQA